MLVVIYVDERLYSSSLNKVVFCSVNAHCVLHYPGLGASILYELPLLPAGDKDIKKVNRKVQGVPQSQTAVNPPRGR